MSPEPLGKRSPQEPSPDSKELLEACAEPGHRGSTLLLSPSLSPAGKCEESQTDGQGAGWPSRGLGGPRGPEQGGEQTQWGSGQWPALSHYLTWWKFRGVVFHSAFFFDSKYAPTAEPLFHPKWSPRGLHAHPFPQQLRALNSCDCWKALCNHTGSSLPAISRTGFGLLGCWGTRPLCISKLASRYLSLCPEPSFLLLRQHRLTQCSKEDASSPLHPAVAFYPSPLQGSRAPS